MVLLFIGQFQVGNLRAPKRVSFPRDAMSTEARLDGTPSWRGPCERLRGVTDLRAGPAPASGAGPASVLAWDPLLTLRFPFPSSCHRQTVVFEMEVNSSRVSLWSLETSRHLLQSFADWNEDRLREVTGGFSDVGVKDAHGVRRTAPGGWCAPARTDVDGGLA